MPYVPLTDDYAPDRYTATAGQTVFPYTFLAFDETDIKVYINGTLKTLTTHYTIDVVGVAAGGNVTLVTGATLNDSVVIERDVPIARASGYSAGGSFRGDTVDLDFKKCLAISQELASKLDRALSLGSTDDTTTPITLPAKATRANKYLKFDANGIPTADLPETTEAAAAAAASAAAAEASALAAAAYPLPPWATATAYSVDRVVHISNKIYVCQESHTSGVFATDLGAGKWTELATNASAITEWATSTDYEIADIVFESNKIYRCDTAHTSGTFATDLAAAKWVELSAVGSHKTSHQSGGSDAIKLDDLASPDDNTDLNVSTSAHGLCPKAPNSTSQFLRGDATWAAVSGLTGGFTNAQTFTASGTWTKPATLVGSVLVIVKGSGGGGGGAHWEPGHAGGGGGEGGIGIGLISPGSLNSTESITIGGGGAAGTTSGAATAGSTGGTCSFGAHISCTGGVGGAVGSAVKTGALGGAGGTSSGGSIANISGAAGGSSSVAAAYVRAGNGGSSWLGQGGRGAFTGDISNSQYDTAAVSPSGYGVGGQGSLKSAASYTAYPAGAGTTGVVIVLWSQT